MKFFGIHHLTANHGDLTPRHKTCVYLDNILITGHSQQEHLKNLEEVLKRLKRLECI